MCCMCVCYKGDIVVMDVIRPRLCVRFAKMLFICSELRKGATS